MKIAITGANGLVGQHLAKELLHRGYTVIATGKGADRNQFSDPRYIYYDVNIEDAFQLHDVLFEHRPDTLVHAAAITQIDDCETNRKHCEAVNEKGTMNALASAELYCGHFIFLSTDFVFDGTKGNYLEEDKLNPVSFYGETKIKGEAMVKQSKIPWTIMRTCLVYGNAITGTRSNIISWVKQSLEQKKSINVVCDQVRTPTYVEDLIKGIILAIEKRAGGVFHISGKDRLTPYEMAIKTAAYFGLDEGLINKVDASSFTQPARRPPITGFDITKAREVLGYEPLSFEEGLAAMYPLKF